MSKHVVCILVGCLAALTGVAQEATSVTELPTAEIFVHRFTELDDALQDVLMIDWSGASNRLLFGKRGVNQYYNVFSVTPDGFQLKSLTVSRDTGAGGRLHSGNAAWHPSGEYFVFTSQNPESTEYRRSVPGVGLHSNLWLGDRQGTQFWRLTNLPTSYTSPVGVAMPQFSSDGKKLFWTGATGSSSPQSVWGERSLFLGDFEMTDRGPRLSGIQEFKPGSQRDFYESYGFLPDGSALLFAGNLALGQAWYSMDIWALGRGEAEPRNLTGSQTWDRFASVSPDGRKIVWTSSRGLSLRYLGSGGARWERYLRTELWIMNSDGTDPKQLTFFNSNGSREYVGRRCFVGDSAWAPDGRRLAIVLHYETRNFDVDSKVMILELGKGELEEVVPGGDAAEAQGGDEPAPAPPREKPRRLPVW